MLRASLKLLIKNENYSLGKSSARQNFRNFQLEHASFLHYKTGEPLSEQTKKKHITKAFRSLSAEHARMFEEEYSDGWKKFLIEQSTGYSSTLFGDAISWKNFKTYQLEHGSFVNAKTGKDWKNPTRLKAISKAFESLNAEEVRLFEGEYSSDWKQFRIGQNRKAVADLIGKVNSVARDNFQEFQLEHAIFVNQITGQPLSNHTKYVQILQAFRNLSDQDVQMFEEDYTADWDDFLIGKKRVPNRFVDTLAWENFSHFQFEHGSFINQGTGKPLMENSKKQMVWMAFRLLDEKDLLIFESKYSADWNRFLIGRKQLAKISLFGKPSSKAIENFKKFQLEHNSFINTKTGEPILEGVRSGYIKEAYNLLDVKEIKMFEGQYNSDWDRYLIEKKPVSIAEIIGRPSALAKRNFRNFQLQHGIFQKSNGEPVSRSHQNYLIKRAFQSLSEEEAKLFEGEHTEVWNQHLICKRDSSHPTKNRNESRSENFIDTTHVRNSSQITQKINRCSA